MIYFDNAATTKESPFVTGQVELQATFDYGNPSSNHRAGRTAKHTVENTRKIIADYINADSPDDIIFTSGGSEANNLAILGETVMMGIASNEYEIITTKIEHPSIRNTCEFLHQKYGFYINYLPVDSNGHVDPDVFDKAFRDNTLLVTMMMVNNEIGTVQNIKLLADIAHEHQVLFHTDAVQAMPIMKIDVQDLGVDMLSASGHKFHGPKGTGFLYASDRDWLNPLIIGGGQENGFRAGTENVPGIRGLGAAVQQLQQNFDSNRENVLAMAQRLSDRLSNELHLPLNSPKKVETGIVNVRFPGIKAERMLYELDQKSICASAGSACSAGNPKPSETLIAIGVDYDALYESIRFSLSSTNTMEEVDTVVDEIKTILKKIKIVG